MTENPYDEHDSFAFPRKSWEAWNEGHAAGDIDGFKRYIKLICDILDEQMEERRL